MVHPTPTLIPQVANTLRSLPPIRWCALTKSFRPLSLWEEMELEMEASNVITSKTFYPNVNADASGSGSKPMAGQSLSANSYPLPPTVLQSQAHTPTQGQGQGQGQGGQRQKQLNNTTPVPPPAPASIQMAEKKVPAPTVFWNDHLRML